MTEVKYCFGSNTSNPERCDKKTTQDWVYIPEMSRIPLHLTRLIMTKPDHNIVRARISELGQIVTISILSCAVLAKKSGALRNFPGNKRGGGADMHGFPVVFMNMHEERACERDCLRQHGHQLGI